jgi:hypothetical protein
MDRAFRTGLLGEDSTGRTERRIAGKNQSEQDRKHKTARMGPGEKDRQNQTSMIGLPGQDH